MRIFIGPSGLRAGWRFLIFLAIAFTLILIFGAAAGFIAPRTSSLGLLLNSYVIAAAGLTALWLMRFIERRPVWDYGFARPNRARNFVIGLISGIASLSYLMAMLLVAGAAHAGPPALHGPEILGWGLYWAIVFIGVGVGEETVLRSYPLFSLSQGLGFWPAAIIVSVLFGLGHTGNAGEEWIGIANAMLAGLVLAWSVRWTGSLWWAIGYHITWDWGESFFYGVADSGAKSHHHFLSFDPTGAAGWLTGGSVGPEGSVLCIPVLLSLMLIVRFATRRWDNPEMAHPQPIPPPPAPLSIDPALPPAG